MEKRSQTASDNISIKSGIPVMSSKGKTTSAIPRLQARMTEQKKPTTLRSKSFDERTASRGFGLMKHGAKNQLKRQTSNTNVVGHTGREKRSGGAISRGASLPRYALDVHKRANSVSKSTSNATSVTPSETCIRLTQQNVTTTTAIVPKKKTIVGRMQQVVSQSTFIAKKKKLEQLKTELQAKQNQVMEAYASILETKKLIEEKTGKTIEVESLELKVEKENSKERPKIDISFVHQMEQKLTKISATYQTLCESLLENRSDIIHWLSMQHACKNHIVSKQLDLYKKEAEKYRQSITECDTAQQTIVSELLENWKTLWEWKETCISEQFSALESENRNVKNMVNDLTCELEKFRSAKTDLEKKLNEAENNLAITRKKMEEKEKDLENMDNKTKLIEKQTVFSYEAKLKIRKQKQKEMEVKIKALEQKIESLNNLNRKMDDELKNKGNTYDSKAKELIKASKLNEALVAKLEQERIGLDMRIKDLQQLLDSRELDYENNLKEYKSSIQTFETKIISMQKEIDNYEKKYSDVRNELIKLQMKCHQDNEIMKKRKFATEPGGPGIHSQTEMDMWNELQTTRVALKATEEKLQRNNEERERFLQTIEKAVEEKDQSSEGWTAKLVLKDKEIECLKHQTEQLSDAIRCSRDLAAKQEKKISDLKKALDSLVANDNAAASAANDAAANSNNKETDPTSVELKIKLEKEYKKTHELEEKLHESEAKMGKLQAKIKELEKMLKVRDGLIGVMKSKKDMTLIEHDELRMYVNDLLHQYNELNGKYESKNKQINDLQTSIECKTMQIERLEKTVKSMEDLCQDSNKTNLDLQERIKFYQKQFEEYQMSVVRPPVEEGIFSNQYTTNNLIYVPHNYHICFNNNPYSGAQWIEKSIQNISNHWYHNKNLSLLDNISLREQFVVQVKKLIQREFIKHSTHIQNSCIEKYN